MRRWLAAVWIVLSLAVLPLAGAAAAAPKKQDSPECGELKSYYKSLKKLNSDLERQYADDIDAIGAVDWQADELPADAPDFFGIAADFEKDYQHGLMQIPKKTMPALIKDWHNARVHQVGVVSLTFQKISDEDIFAAFARYGDAWDAANQASYEAQQVVVDACPSFLKNLEKYDALGDIVDYDTLTPVAPEAAP